MFGMRLVLAFACLLFVPPALGASRADDVLDRAKKTVREHRLLSAAEAACSTFILTDIDAQQVAGVTVAEKHGGRCKGDPQVAPARFHLEIDLRGGAVKWDNNDDIEMRPVP